MHLEVCQCVGRAYFSCNRCVCLCAARENTIDVCLADGFRTLKLRRVVP